MREKYAVCVYLCVCMVTAFSKTSTKKKKKNGKFLSGIQNSNI